jgi:vacuolar-type H+-ATPase subunit H
MGSSTEASVLDALEQAEMAARERRLAASNEAEDVLSAAQQRASAISAQAGQRVEDALDELRHAAEAEAEAAIEDLERAATLRATAGTNPGEADAHVEGAVAIVVAHVLGEVTPEPADEERA